MVLRTGDYMQMGAPRERRTYEEVGGDFNQLTNLMTNYLEEYNLEHTAPLHLGKCSGIVFILFVTGLCFLT